MADASDALDPGHLVGHVKDSSYFEVPRLLSRPMAGTEDGKLHLPQPFLQEEPLVSLPAPFGPLELRFTKFMALELIAAIILVITFVWLAQKIKRGGRPTGRLWNMLEAMLVFIRDEVARPAIGKHDADKFVPFLWTLFFFVLICNLLGMLPWAGSPTGSLATTGALALITFGAVVGAGMMKMGPGKFWIGLVPHMDLPPVLMVFLWPMVFAIELLGLFIKHFVLAVRLLANMFAGHLVLAVIVAFIAATYESAAWWGVMPASIIGAVALSLLELFVAFLQAYIFAFLSALFIGMAVHPH